MNLYEINEQIQKAIEDGVSPDTGEILHLDFIEELHMDLKEKVKNIAYYIKKLEDNDVAIKNEEVRIKAIKESNKKKIEKLKEYLVSGIELSGLKKFEYETMTVSLRNNAPRLILSDDIKDELEYDLNIIESDLSATKKHIAEQKKEIKEKLKNGDEIKGCYLESKKTISIK